MASREAGTTRAGGLARQAVIEAAWLALGAANALLVLRYLHEQWQPWIAALVGVLGANGLRRIVRPGLAAFPTFLRRPVDLAVAVVGVLAGCLATVPAFYALPYWVERRQAILAVAAAFVLLGLATTAMVYTHARFGGEITRARATEAALREAALRARLAALQAQVNPHFLFNALNALAELTRSDAVAAERLVEDLAHLLRYSLKSSAEGLVPLSQELEAVRRYLRVEHARLGERLRVEVDAPDDVLGTLIPGLVLQPLVENAVRHAAAARAGGASVSLSARRGDGVLHVRVEDDGPGLPASVLERFRADAVALAEGRTPGEDDPEAARSGTGGAGGGLANVQQRLALAYRGRARLELHAREGSGTRFELEIPA